ncbi:MAG: hypothetical protein JWQ49_2224 [Edaphobacter sp.]|nr:hypothetical protein [Edaphobacter sp.]
MLTGYCVRQVRKRATDLSILEPAEIAAILKQLEEVEPVTKRPIFGQIRSQMLGSFENIGGILVDGSAFFQIKGSWPVAFTMWRYKGRDARLESERTIPLLDLTWLTKKQLTSINWNDETEVERECKTLYRDPRAVTVALGEDRVSLREWTGETMLDFKRSRRRNEINQTCVGGLPSGDHRLGNKKAYGETDGKFIGFMDELTPCRVKRSTPDRPWFYLDTRFMSTKKARCLSGPPTHLGYCAKDLESAKKFFFWYSLARTFLQHPYPMWADSDNMWQPMIPPALEAQVCQAAFAIGYAENECVTTTFPSYNPVKGLPELTIRNPLTPLDNQSFWSTTLRPFCEPTASSGIRDLICSVDDLFTEWRKVFRNCSEVPISKKPYLIGTHGLTIGAGIVQIRDYMREESSPALQQRLGEVQAKLRIVKSEFFGLATSSAGFDYFGPQKKAPSSVRVSNIDRSVATYP